MSKAKQKELEDARAASAKAQSAYYRACTELEQADWLLHAKIKQNQAAVKKRDELRLKHELCRTQYAEAVEAMNTIEAVVHGAVGALLTELRQMESNRLDLTRTTIMTYLAVTADQLPSMIGEPITNELGPMVAAVDAQQNLTEALAKQARREPVVAPGKNEVIEYDQFRDCVDEHRSIDQLRELAGGPVKEGQLEREVGIRKRFEQRQCIVWPKDWKARDMLGPKLFLYDSGEVKPDRVLQLHAAACTDLQNPRKERPDAFRISSDGKEIVISGVRQSEFGTAEWRSLLTALAKGEAVTMTKLFGASLNEIMLQQQADVAAAACRAPAILFSCFDQLDKLSFTVAEGVFRIPGDTVEISAMKRLFERGLVQFSPEKHEEIDLGNVANWSSLLKAWLR